MPSLTFHVSIRILDQDEKIAGFSSWSVSTGEVDVTQADRDAIREIADRARLEIEGYLERRRR